MSSRRRAGRCVAFILSTSYAGSHFASLMIGSHSSASHVGETCQLRKDPPDKPVCARCGDHRKCPLFEHVDPARLDLLFDAVFAALPPEKTLIVDNSKKTRWVARFLDRPGFDKKIIHLVRDPRALVRRFGMMPSTLRGMWRRRLRGVRRDPGRWLTHLFASRQRLDLETWLRQNRRITDFVSERGLDHIVVTYRDLALDTERQLGRVMEFLGMDLEPGQLEYWNVDHHGTEKQEYEWVKSAKTRHFDLRWKAELSEEAQESVISDPAVARYLAQIGLRATPEGLTIESRS